MTWTKLGSEFFDDCAEAGLSDAAVRTHLEAIGYLYGQENYNLTLKKSTMGRWAGSDQREQASADLVAAGMWRDSGTEWTVVHHADVIRQSLTAQLKKREDDKEGKRKRRRAPVGTDVGSDVAATQTDSQTGSTKDGPPTYSSEAINPETVEVLTEDESDPFLRAGWA